MLDRLRQFFQRPSRDPALAQMRRDIGAHPSSYPIEDLRPVLIPSPILELEDWIGPKHHFGSLPVSLTWAYLRPENTMMYLSFDAAASLEARGIDWRVCAKQAVQQHFVQQLWTHEFTGESGAVEAVALLHSDGLGPSRLLCLEELRRKLPDGFLWSVPERSCALVISKTASRQVRGKVVTAIERCYASADVPMSKEEFLDEELSGVVRGLAESA
jgi:hypothetical protein